MIYDTDIYTYIYVYFLFIRNYLIGSVNPSLGPPMVAISVVGLFPIVKESFFCIFFIWGHCVSVTVAGIFAWLAAGICRDV